MCKDCIIIGIQVELFKDFLIRDTTVGSAFGCACKKVVVLVHIKVVVVVDTILVSQIQVQIGG